MHHILSIFIVTEGVNSPWNSNKYLHNLAQVKKLLHTEPVIDPLPWFGILEIWLE